MEVLASVPFAWLGSFLACADTREMVDWPYRVGLTSASDSVAFMGCASGLSSLQSRLCLVGGIPCLHARRPRGFTIWALYLAANLFATKAAHTLTLSTCIWGSLVHSGPVPMSTIYDRINAALVTLGKRKGEESSGDGHAAGGSARKREHRLKFQPFSQKDLLQRLQTYKCVLRAHGHKMLATAHADCAVPCALRCTQAAHVVCSASCCERRGVRDQGLGEHCARHA